MRITCEIWLLSAQYIANALVSWFVIHDETGHWNTLKVETPRNVAMKHIETT